MAYIWYKYIHYMDIYKGNNIHSAVIYATHSRARGLFGGYYRLLARRAQRAARDWLCVLTSSSGEDGAEAGFGQDAGDGFAVVALNFNPAILDRSSDAAGFSHGLGELLFLCLGNAGKALNNDHRFSAAMRRLPHNIHPAPILWTRRLFG